MSLEKLPEEDGDGYIVHLESRPFIGYVFKGLNNKWAAYSQYGSAMTDHIYDTPEEAMNYETV